MALGFRTSSVTIPNGTGRRSIAGSATFGSPVKNANSAFAFGLCAALLLLSACNRNGPTPEPTPTPCLVDFPVVNTPWPSAT